MTSDIVLILLILTLAVFAWGLSRVIKGFLLGVLLGVRDSGRTNTTRGAVVMLSSPFIFIFGFMVMSLMTPSSPAAYEGSVRRGPVLPTMPAQAEPAEPFTLKDAPAQTQAGTSTSR